MKTYYSSDLKTIFPQIILMLVLLFLQPAKGSGIDRIRTYAGMAVSTIEFEGYTYAPEINKMISGTSGIELSFFEEPFGNFSTRISYMERGGNEDNSSGSTSKVSFYYLSLGVLYKYRYSMKFVNPTVSFGPSFDYLLRPSYEAEYISGSQVSPSFKEYNCGFDLGAGLEEEITDNIVLSLDFTWNYQFIPVFEDFDKEMMMKNAFLFTVGLEYKFNNEDEL